ncbi:MAG: hypothetical protein JKY89_01280 [Immundisolibacteraceae bacterium]|nr:hypothetical protein [Immundisolibacteraceae bacterium]
MTSFVDINEYDCVQWSLINADITNIKTHILCIKCNNWYLRKKKFLNEQCSSCLGLEPTKQIKTEFTFCCWDNDTSIVIQQRFRHGKTRSISIPLHSKDPEQFSNRLVDKLKNDLSWSEAKEEAQEFKRSNDHQSKLKTLKELQQQFVNIQQSITQIIKELGYE